MFDDEIRTFVVPSILTTIGGLVVLAVWHIRRPEQSADDDVLGSFLDEAVTALNWDACSDDDDDDDDDTPGAGIARFVRALASSRFSVVLPHPRGERIDPRVAELLSNLAKLSRGDSTLKSHALALIRTLNLATEAWKSYETVRRDQPEGDKLAFTFDLLTADNIHASLLLIGLDCRPAMPGTGDAGILLVLCGEIMATLHRATNGGHSYQRILACGDSTHFIQSATHILRTTSTPALALYLRMPAR